MSEDMRRRLCELLIQMIECRMTPEEFAELDEMLRTSAAAREFYLTFVTVQAGLGQTNVDIDLDTNEDGGVHQVMTDRLAQEREGHEALRNIVEQDLSKSAIQRAIDVAAEEEIIERRIVPQKRRYVFTRQDFVQSLTRIAAIVLFALSIVWLDAMVWRSQQPPVRIGKITALRGEVHIEGTTERVRRDDVLFANTYAVGEQGYLECRLDNGVVTLVEGPARVQVQGQREFFMDWGKIFANVPQQAIGFTVSSPSSRVIDLGTEFGIEVQSDGSSRVYTYDGSVSLINMCESASISSEILTAGAARQVDGQTGTKRKIGFKEDYFARKISENHAFIWRGQSSLDLGDILCGGNGFGTGDRNRIIDPMNGQYLALRQAKRNRHRIWKSRDYMSVQQNQYIDGLFVPVGESKPVVVSSLGHTFAAFPDTDGRFSQYMGNLSYTDIEFLRHKDTPASSDHLKHLHGSDDSVVYMHSNLGVTFDLKRMRDRLGGMQLTSFEATCLNYGEPSNDDRGSLADFFVLIDGEPRLEARDVAMDTPVPVSIALSGQDRFLTLVTTMGSDRFGSWFDRTLFVNPRLSLSAGQ